MKNSIRMNNQRIYANSESFLNSIDHFSKISINLIDGIRCKLYNEVTLNKIRIMITEKFFLINCEKSFEANSRLNCLPQFLLHASNNFHFGGGKGSQGIICINIIVYLLLQIVQIHLDFYEIFVYILFEYKLLAYVTRQLKMKKIPTLVQRIFHKFLKLNPNYLVYFFLMYTFLC